jgi:hypothetical protein
MGLAALVYDGHVDPLCSLLGHARGALFYPEFNHP